MLGFLLARRGIDVVVLEKHGDFLRDFRGDTIHPSTLAVMQELGLADELLSLPYMTAPVLNVWTHRVSSRWPTSAVSRRPGPISPFFHNGIS